MHLNNKSTAMHKQTSLYIPTPCHEDWNKMTPTQQGKFCGSCNKQIVDFSLMSDNQILNFLSNQAGKTCGRFDVDQLQRPLIETKIKKEKGWWMALTMPLLFLFERSGAQKNTVVGDTIYNVVPPNTTVEKALMNKVPICEPVEQIIATTGLISLEPPRQRTINGSVIDENNNPLAFVSIYQKGTNHGTTSDSLGNFSININFDSSNSTIVVSYVGYETIEKQIELNEPETIITMQQKPTTLNDVIVTSGPITMGKMVTLGGAVAICQRINPVDTIKTSIKKIFNISAFKIYPNPAIKGSNIHLEIKQPGNYQLQLLNNQSRLIKAEEINVDTKNATTQIHLPSNITAGVYYLRLIDEQTKSYTEKLIIQ